ncbi:pheromone-binding protein-like [Anabrus simplex]|uniref:pheromone-binding protein-like n=1 Tax=Anabrus simplex TaxID=316456 RepID=UPI0035A2D9E2
MKFTVGLLLSITGIVLAQTQQENTDEGIERCLAENGLTSEILSNATAELERNVTCFISCMGQNTGVVDKDGNPIIEKAKEFVVKQFEAEEDRKEALQVLEECVQEVKKIDSDDVCLKGYTLFQCMMPRNHTLFREVKNEIVNFRCHWGQKTSRDLLFLESPLQFLGMFNTNKVMS